MVLVSTCARNLRRVLPFFHRCDLAVSYGPEINNLLLDQLSSFPVPHALILPCRRAFSLGDQFHQFVFLHLELPEKINQRIPEVIPGVAIDFESAETCVACNMKTDIVRAKLHRPVEVTGYIGAYRGSNGFFCCHVSVPLVPRQYYL